MVRLAMHNVFLSVFVVLVQISFAEDVADTSAWGPDVYGLQCRAESDKPFWYADETPEFTVSVRNNGLNTVSFPAYPFSNMELLVDGECYNPISRNHVYSASLAFSPGDIRQGISIPLNYDLWTSEQDQSSLWLTPGKHSVVFIFNTKAEPYKDVENICIVSDPIEFEISTTPSETKRDSDALSQPAKYFSVSGHVLDRLDGNAVQGLIVRLWDSGSGKQQFAKTADDGSYIFEEVQASQYAYRVELKGPPSIGTSESLNVNVRNSDVELRDMYTTLPQSVSGTIRDADTGLGVNGATLGASTDKNEIIVTSGQDGNYKLYVQPGKVTIESNGTRKRYLPDDLQQVIHPLAARIISQNDSEFPGAIPYISGRNVDVEPHQQVTGIDFNFKSALAVTGTVVYPDGSPAAYRAVNLCIRWSGNSNSRNGGDVDALGTGSDLRLITDQQGWFTGYVRRPIQRDWHEDIQITASLTEPYHFGFGHIATDTDAKQIPPMMIVLEEYEETGIAGETAEPADIEIINAVLRACHYAYELSDIEKKQMDYRRVTRINMRDFYTRGLNGPDVVIYRTDPEPEYIIPPRQNGISSSSYDLYHSDHLQITFMRGREISMRKDQEHLRQVLRQQIQELFE